MFLAKRRAAGTKHRWMALAGLVSSLGLGACKPKVAQIVESFVDTCDRAELGPQWLDTGGGYALAEGAVFALELDATAMTRVGSDVKVETGRKGGKIDRRLDDKPSLSWVDPAPFEGSAHEYFAFNNWDADVRFDSLSIRTTS